MPNKKSSKAAPTRQVQITESALPLLKKPLDHVGKQIGFPGGFWEGRQTAEEKATIYKCTIRDFSALHKWDGGRTPSAAFELQEMGVLGTGSLEHGDSSGEIFFCSYPSPFLSRGRMAQCAVEAHSGASRATTSPRRQR